jgi:hypothetical protein
MINTTDNLAAGNRDETRVFLMDLWPGQHWMRYPDANVVVLSAHLDEVGQEQALAEAGVR